MCGWQTSTVREKGETVISDESCYCSWSENARMHSLTLHLLCWLRKVIRKLLSSRYQLDKGNKQNSQNSVFKCLSCYNTMWKVLATTIEDSGFPSKLVVYFNCLWSKQTFEKVHTKTLKNRLPCTWHGKPIAILDRATNVRSRNIYRMTCMPRTRSDSPSHNHQTALYQETIMAALS